MIGPDRTTAAEMSRAERIAAQVQAKVAKLLAPLEMEMRVMKWQPEFRAILWENVAMEAIARAKACSDPPPSAPGRQRSG